MPVEASPPVSAGDAPRPLILFDGVCNLCEGTVRWVLARDRRQRFHFASLQSAAAAAALAEVRAPDAAPLPDSLVLLDADGLHLRSSAALRIAGQLGLPWSLARVLLLVPPVLRDAVYDWVARHRYRWFGRKDACLVPTPELAARFLDADEVRDRGGDGGDAADG